MVLAACGGLDPVPLDRYGAAAEDALCDWAVACRHVPDDATCRRFIDPKRYDTRRAAESIAAGRLAYDPGAAARCLDTGRRGPCPSSFDDPSCAQVFVGRVAQGGACTSRLECAAGAECGNLTCAAGCCRGTCGAPAVVPPPPAPVGASCQTHFDCVAIAYCDQGTCRELPKNAGDPCLFGCWYGDLTCDVETLTCVQVAGLGEACADRPCDAAWAYCDGVCRPRPGAGDACDATGAGGPIGLGAMSPVGGRGLAAAPSIDVRCIPTTWCDGATCQPRGGPGATCTMDPQCDFACDAAAGQCVPYASCAPQAAHTWTGRSVHSVGFDAPGATSVTRRSPRAPDTWYFHVADVPSAQMR